MLREQRNNIRQLFLTRPNTWIPLPEIMKFAAQYNARLYELRKEGLDIRNQTKVISGIKHSWYMFTPKTQNQYTTDNKGQLGFI